MNVKRDLHITLSEAVRTDEPTQLVNIPEATSRIDLIKKIADTGQIKVPDDTTTRPLGTCFTLILLRHGEITQQNWDRAVPGNGARIMIKFDLQEQREFRF